jgi:hypothetical protein
MPRRTSAVILLPCVLTAGCIAVPEPPPPTEDLSGLTQRYENPSAELPEDRIRELLAEAIRIDSIAQLLRGLRFVRTAVTDTSLGLENNTTAEKLDVQGRVQARVPCPGDAPTADFNAPESGAVRVAFGVEGSKLLRGFAGAVEECRFRVQFVVGEAQHVVLSGRLTGDLGADLRIGSPLPKSLLLKLSGVTGESVATSTTVDLSRTEYHFRLTEDGALESLLDSAELGLGDFGSVVLVVHPEGSLALRERRGEWVCAENSACELLH